MNKPGTASGGVVMDMHQGDAIVLGEDITVKVLAKSGRITRVYVVAPRDVRISKRAGRHNESDRVHVGREHNRIGLPSMAD